ncbi:hypothetical protein POM88_007184 [Heracleum sosnowskyi]|uniref:Uncharacterized protein n=1 Tax=Heracleum sosnowskyi TaxID=360622 RepID=A0AAD8N685_9APIA|nr:hypothetical protein POM88_007184 [Heracleum sosnowskyi]
MVRFIGKKLGILSPRVEWPAWPSVTKKVPKANEVPSSQNKGVDKGKRKLAAKGGKAKKMLKKLPTFTNFMTEAPLQVYIGPNLLGLVKTPVVKQFKTIIGGVEVQSAAFLKNGNFVFTKGALTKAREDAEAKAEKAREDKELEKDREDGNGDAASVDKDKAGK